MPPTTPTTIDLFPEILLEVFKNKFTNTDLKNYSLVCSKWYFPAQERLFAKLTLRSLSSRSPNTLPYSVMAEDPRYAHILRYIRRLTFRLKSNSPVDPAFPAFLRHLTSLRELRFLNSGKWLFKENYGPEMQGAIYHLISLPLNFLELCVDYFPAELLTACTNISSLSVGFIQGLNTIDLTGQTFPLTGRSPTMPKLLRLFGNMVQLGHFTQTILSDSKYNISLKRVKKADLYFVQVMPCLEGTIFSLLGNVQAINMHFSMFQIGQAQASVWAVADEDVKKLMKVKVIMFTMEFSEETRRDVDYIQLLLSDWIIPFLKSLPKPSTLHRLAFRIRSESDTPLLPALNLDEILAHVKTNDGAFKNIWRRLDAILSDESAFPLLKRCSMKIPWLQTQASLQGIMPESAKRFELDAHRLPFSHL